ncbi:hypothetical protein L7F22_033829 [Adiantum nelumboides]|nr:hypothetical protein [Adiantum nelumboides]
MESSERLTSLLILPNEIIQRVLSFLSLKELFRLRCVCKLWHSLPFSFLFGDIPHQDAVWLFAFRILARKVNEYRRSTYKATYYSYSVAYDREMLGVAGYDLQLPLCSPDSDPLLQKSYAILTPECPLIALLSSGVMDIVASSHGLLIFTLRLSKVQDHEENNLKLFVYNPISRDIRSLPATRYAPQKLSMVPCKNENEVSGYKINSIGRSYRPGTKNLLYSLEVFDSTQAQLGWQFVSHVRANLAGSGDLHPGTETSLMGYINSKAIGNELGFLYWMPSLEHRSETGRHAELSCCHVTTGFLYGLPGLPFKTTFAEMWPCRTGLMLVCGLAQEDDMSYTCGVEIWELLQGEQGLVEDEGFYGGRCPPQGVHGKLTSHQLFWSISTQF